MKVIFDMFSSKMMKFPNGIIPIIFTIVSYFMSRI